MGRDNKIKKIKEEVFIVNKIDEKIRLYGIMPIITIENVEDAVPTAKALCDGGLPIAEVTFRTSQAKEAIKEITKAFPDMLMGAGTVLTKEQVDQSIEAGAKFIVTPGINPNIVKYCIEKNMPIYPGCATPSDLDLAVELGLNIVKFFPSEQLGGIRIYKSNSCTICKYVICSNRWYYRKKYKRIFII